MLVILASCSSVRFSSWNLSMTITRASWAASWVYTSIAVTKANTRHTILMASLLLLPGNLARGRRLAIRSKNNSSRRLPMHPTDLQRVTSSCASRERVELALDAHREKFSVSLLIERALEQDKGEAKRSASAPAILR